jgi:transposase InsO family protein
VAAAGVEPHHLLRPSTVNQVWQLDLTVVRWLWLRFTVAALMDSFSRKLLALTVYFSAPTSRDMLQLLRGAVRRFGQPRFLITDHGCQFRTQFKRSIEADGITHVKGPVRCPTFNGKIERLFRTARQWLRFTLLPVGPRPLKRRLNIFRDWYNTIRPHSALGQLTPEEAWQGNEPPAPIPIRARENGLSILSVKRSAFRGDPRLPELRIDVAFAA